LRERGSDDRRYGRCTRHCNCGGSDFGKFGHG
jgi:hypothetical protein